MDKKMITDLLDVISYQVKSIERELHQLRPYELIERLPGEPAQAGDVKRSYDAFGKPMYTWLRKMYFNRSKKEQKHIASLERKLASYVTIRRNLRVMLADCGRPAYVPPVVTEAAPVDNPEEEKPDVSNWITIPEKRDIEVTVPYGDENLVLTMTSKEKDRFDLLMNKLATDDIRLCEKEIQEHKNLLEHIKEETKEAKRIAERKLIADYNYIVSLPKSSREEIWTTECVNAIIDDMRKTGAIIPNCKMCREKFGTTDQHRCDVCARAQRDVLTKNLNEMINPEINRPLPKFIKGMALEDYTKSELVARYRKVDTGMRIVWERIPDDPDAPKKERWFLKGLSKTDKEDRLNWLALMVMKFWQMYPGLEEYKDAIVMMKSLLKTAYNRMCADIHCNIHNVFEEVIEPMVNAKIGIESKAWTTKEVEISAEERESFYDNKNVRVERDNLGNEHFFVRKFCKKAEFVELEQKFNDMAHADEEAQEGELRGMAYFSECPYMENGYLMESFVKYYRLYGVSYDKVLRGFRNKYDRTTTSESRTWAQEHLKNFFLGAIGFLGLDKEDYFFQKVNGKEWFRTRKAVEFYAYLAYLSKAMEKKDCTSIKKYFDVQDNSVEEYFKKYSITSELMG